MHRGFTESVVEQAVLAWFEKLRSHGLASVMGDRQ